MESLAMSQINNISLSTVKGDDVSEYIYSEVYQNIPVSARYSLESIADKHLAEWRLSGIDDQITVINLKSLSGDRAFDHLLYADHLDRRNDGRLTDGLMYRYRHLENGGWWVNGINPLTGEPRLFGQFKPDTAYISKDGKPVKYEQPPKIPYEPIFLTVPDAIADQCAGNIGLGQSWSEAKTDGINFWEWVIARPQGEIWITEGVKKAAALLSQGKIAIALTSITTACVAKPKDLPDRVASLDKLLPDLKQFSAKGRKINICFDQDEKLKTQKAVFSQVKRIGKLFKNDGCLVHTVIWDKELGKGIDDLIVNHSEWEKQIKIVKLLDYINNIQDKRLTYPVNQTINQRYLDGLTIPDDTDIIALLSAKGTGKTEWIGKYVQPFLNQGYRVLILSHRRQLAHELSNRLGIDYIDEILEGSDTQGIFGYGLCVDSLHAKARLPFKLGSWLESPQPYIVVMDECEQVLWHFLNAKTEVKKNRCEIIDNVNTLIQGSSKLILSDADLSDLSLKYMTSVMTYQDSKTELSVIPKTHLVVNEYKGLTYDCHVYQDSNPSGLFLALKESLASGKKAFVCLSSQKAKGVFSSQTLEKDLKKQFPDLKILRIDADTISDPTHSAYGIITHLNESIIRYDCVIVTPTIETGVSIDVKHFDAVFGIFQGVQPCDTVRQMLMRVRETVERHIWIAPIGLCKVGNGKADYKDLLEPQKQLFNQHIKNLSSVGLSSNINGNFSPIALETYCKFGARINWGNSHYRDEIIKGLKNEGHNIILKDPTDKNTVKVIRDELKETRDTNHTEICEKISASETLTNSEFEALDRKQNKTEIERFKHRKGKLQRIYHTDKVTSDLVKADDKKLYPKLQLHYALTIGRDYVAQKDKEKAEKQIENGKGNVFLSDFNKSQYLFKIQILERLGINKLLQKKQWSNDDPELMAIADQVQACRDGLRKYEIVGISEKMTPIAIAQTLLGMIGLKLPFLKKTGNGRAGKSERVRIYGPAISLYDQLIPDADTPSNKLMGIPDGRGSIFQAWLEKDLERFGNQDLIANAA
jgi:hypothetical protein